MSEGTCTFRVPDGREFTIGVTESNSWWTEGNGACDCNRSLYIRRAGFDLPLPPGCKDQECWPCGDSIKLVATTTIDPPDEVPCQATS